MAQTTMSALSALSLLFHSHDKSKQTDAESAKRLVVRSKRPIDGLLNKVEKLRIVDLGLQAQKLSKIEK